MAGKIQTRPWWQGRGRVKRRQKTKYIRPVEKNLPLTKYRFAQIRFNNLECLIAKTMYVLPSRIFICVITDLLNVNFSAELKEGFQEAINKK